MLNAHGEEGLKEVRSQKSQGPRPKAETASAALNMDIDLRRRMLDYYDERAPEYEEAYTLGTGTASIPDTEVFRTEAKSLAGIVRTFAQGHLIDLACGTAYWLRHYADSCGQITLFDQSEKMLQEGRTKVADLGIENRCIGASATTTERRNRVRNLQALL